jgi:ClpP class serine protease
VALANTMAGSAAYYLAAAADEVVVSPSGELGSIGVFYAHADESEADAKAGIKVTVFSGGEGKADFAYGPLSDDAKAYMQGRVNEFYDMFARDVAKARGVSVDTVRKDWKALVYGAKAAVGNGMADRVATLEETLARLSTSNGRRTSFRGAVADDGEADRRLLALRMSGA